MSGKGNGHQPSRDSERVPIRAEVDLEFESFQGFLSEYSANISLGGMFVRATDPPPVGTVLRFSLKLKGDFKLIQGRGEVAWNRREGSSAEEPAGAGIRFLELEPASADLIRRMVDRYKVQGGQPFSLEGEPVDSTSAEASILEAPPGQAFRDDIFIHVSDIDMAGGPPMHPHEFGDLKTRERVLDFVLANSDRSFCTPE